MNYLRTSHIYRVLLLAVVVLVVGAALPSSVIALASPEPPCEPLPGEAPSETCEEEIAGWHAEQEEDKRREEQEDREIQAEEKVVREQEHREAVEAREWAHKPTVTKPIAEEFAKRLMRKSHYSIWEVDCDGGRRNRTHWSCKVSIFYHCLRGRILVTGAGHKNGRSWYRADGGRLRQCRV